MSRLARETQTDEMQISQTGTKSSMHHVVLLRRPSTSRMTPPQFPTSSRLPVKKSRRAAKPLAPSPPLSAAAPLPRCRPQSSLPHHCPRSASAPGPSATIASTPASLVSPCMAYTSSLSQSPPAVPDLGPPSGFDRTITLFPILVHCPDAFAHGLSRVRTDVGLAVGITLRRRISKSPDVLTLDFDLSLATSGALTRPVSAPLRQSVRSISQWSTSE